MNEFLLFFIGILANILYIALIGRVLFSWINVGPSNPLYPIASILHQVTEPVLAPIRRVLPSFGMLDFSPMVAMVLILVVHLALQRALG